jgi:hypothetical protein
MKAFEVKYEGQKIPEWYTLYFDYKRIKDVINEHKEKIKSKTHCSGVIRIAGKETTKLEGIFFINPLDEVFRMQE